MCLPHFRSIVWSFKCLNIKFSTFVWSSIVCIYTIYLYMYIIYKHRSCCIIIRLDLCICFVYFRFLCANLRSIYNFQYSLLFFVFVCLLKCYPPSPRQRIWYHIPYRNYQMRRNASIYMYVIIVTIYNWWKLWKLSERTICILNLKVFQFLFSFFFFAISFHVLWEFRN